MTHAILVAEARQRLDGCDNNTKIGNTKEHVDGDQRFVRMSYALDCCYEPQNVGIKYENITQLLANVARVFH